MLPYKMIGGCSHKRKRDAVLISLIKREAGETLTKDRKKTRKEQKRGKDGLTLEKRTRER